METRRLLAALAVTALLMGPFAYVVYDLGFAQSATAVGGLAILLALALGVAWASHHKETG
jgi:hypothetical protein